MPPPLIVHLIHQLDLGGLENELANLINHMPRQRYRHVIVCLKDFTEFHSRKEQWRRQRLLLVGDGPCRAPCQKLVSAAGAANLATRHSRRFGPDDARDGPVRAALGRGQFQRHSRSDGECFPVVATNVGGTAALIRTDWNGTLVPPSAPIPQAEAIANY